MANAINNFINKMTAKELIIKRNALINVSTKQNGNGHRFFTCGQYPNGDPITGYITEEAANKWMDPQASLDDFQYAEIINDKDGNPFTDAKGNPRPLPVLMLVGKTQTTTMNRGLELLR